MNRNQLSIVLHMRALCSEGIGEIIGMAIDVNDEDHNYVSSFVAFAKQGEFQIW